MKTIELSFSESGNIVANFSKNDIRHYSAYQFVQDYSNKKNYLVAHKGQGCLDLFEVQYFKGNAIADYIEKDCLKIKENSGFTRLFAWDGSLETHFVAFQGYDFSPFENAMIYNLDKQVRLVIFDEERLLVEEVGYLISNSQKGVVIADSYSEGRREKHWYADEYSDYLCPVEASPQTVKEEISWLWGGIKRLFRIK